MPICAKCNAYIPNRIKIDGRNYNLQNRKFCIACSPFKAHNTRDLTREPRPVHSPCVLPDVKFCRRCERTLPITDFYKISNREGVAPYCKPCTNKQTVERQQRLKQQIVEYLGGCRQHCGYDKYIGSLDIHHRDATEKEFDFAHARSTTFEKIKPELDKSALLCADCHWEEHARIRGVLPY